MQIEGIDSFKDIESYLLCGKTDREDRENFLEIEYLNKLRAYSLNHGEVYIFKLNPKSKFPIYGFRVSEWDNKSAYPITWTSDFKLNENFLMRDLYPCFYYAADKTKNYFNKIIEMDELVRRQGWQRTGKELSRPKN